MIAAAETRRAPRAYVRFYGHLRAEFGKGYPLDVKTPAEAVRALGYVLKGFARYMRKHSLPGYRVTVDRVPIEAEDELLYPAVGKIIRIVPVVAGRAGLGKIIVGAALIGFSLAFPGVGAFLSTSVSNIAFSMGVNASLGAYSGSLDGPRDPVP
jgi:predicted phage tail protein